MGKIQDFLWDLMPVASLHRPVAYHVSATNIRGWRNPMYDCCAAHAQQMA